MRRHPILVFSTILIAVGAVSANSYAQIVPPNATYRGRTYQQWQVKYAQDLVATPVVANRHPYLTGEAFGGEDGVLFLAGGNFVPAPDLSLTISADTALFFPIVQFEDSFFESPQRTDEASLRTFLNNHLDAHPFPFATIDGVSVDPTPYRTQTPLFEWGPLPENHLFQAVGLPAPAGTTSPAVDVGYYLLLEPLSVGQHVIHYGFGPVLDKIYRITVVPEPASVMIAGIAALAGIVPSRKGRRR
jgi:hypothetical protein